MGRQAVLVDEAAAVLEKSQGAFPQNFFYRFRFLLFFILFASLGIFFSCSVQTMKRKLTPPKEAASLALEKKESPYLKAHMLNGHVYVLSNWDVVTIVKTVSGSGRHLGPNREILEEGDFTILIDSVAIFETNKVQTSPAVAGLAVLTAASVFLTIYCIANPKACFGSCPTFYAWDGNKSLLQAEGFSSSVAPALGKKDIDALFRAKATGRNFEVKMRNEALETHVIHYVDLLAVPRPENGRAFVTSDGEFWQAKRLVSPNACLGSEGDCLELLRVLDGRERYSAADSHYLAARETLDVEFDNLPDGRLGLVLAARQSLLTTFLFYQTLAYMGTSAGEWFATLERMGKAARMQADGLGQKLGWIEVLVQDSSDGWVSVGRSGETGPMGTDVRVIPLPQLPAGATKIRLNLTRGHWRLDWLALAELEKQAEPLRLEPSIVRKGGGVDEGTKKMLADSAGVLVTYPGDEYTLVYRLPEDFSRYELFLESRGYYLEWMRKEWLAEEDFSKAAMMFFNPDSALRMLAPEFKKVEAEMEGQFWGSKYVRP